MDQELLHNEFVGYYESMNDAVFRFCILRVSDREQALDITQETFLRLWNSLRNGDKITNPKSFIFTIAHHLVIDWYRKKKSISLDAMANDDTDEPYEPQDELAASNLNLAAEGRFLLGSIDKLSQSYRQVVYLRYVEGLTIVEISQILNASTNAVSVRLNRGIGELRRITGYDGVE